MVNAMKEEGKKLQKQPRVSTASVTPNFALFPQAQWGCSCSWGLSKVCLQLQKITGDHCQHHSSCTMHCSDTALVLKQLSGSYLCAPAPLNSSSALGGCKP